MDCIFTRLICCPNVSSVVFSSAGIASASSVEFEKSTLLSTIRRFERNLHFLCPFRSSQVTLSSAAPVRCKQFRRHGVLLSHPFPMRMVRGTKLLIFVLHPAERKTTVQQFELSSAFIVCFSRVHCLVHECRQKGVCFNAVEQPCRSESGCG